MIIREGVSMAKLRARKCIDFELVPLREVPSREPSTKPSSSQKGSQWDEALQAIESERGRHAIKIGEPSPKKRGRLKATLQTMARKRGCFVEVREDASSVYAWASDKGGRFAAPASDD